MNEERLRQRLARARPEPPEVDSPHRTALRGELAARVAARALGDRDSWHPETLFGALAGAVLCVVLLAMLPMATTGQAPMIGDAASELKSLIGSGSNPTMSAASVTPPEPPSADEIREAIQSRHQAERLIASW